MEERTGTREEEEEEEEEERRGGGEKERGGEWYRITLRVARLALIPHYYAIP